MASPNGRGGWDITDAEAAEVIERSEAESAARQRAWRCLGCGEPWTGDVELSGAPLFGLTCPCGDCRWTFRGDRSKAGNADRLEAMAAESANDDGDLAECQAERDTIADLLNMGRRTRRELDDALAECDRLRVIVDLACAEHEAKHVSEDGFEYSHKYPAWVAAKDALDEAVAAEVSRRAATK